MLDHRADQDIRFTGMVVTYNEARRLRECLRSLAFCDELLVFDLGSSDESVAIARECGAQVLHHEWVPTGDYVFAEFFSRARNDWIIRLDPDEVFPGALLQDVQRFIESDPRIGIIALPFQFYVRGEPLNTTIWACSDPRPRIFHKDRVIVEHYVHDWIHCADGYTRVPIRGGARIQHYWVESFAQLVEKHRRYLQLEGESRYHRGERFTWRQTAWYTGATLKHNLIEYNGWRGGWNGILLSFFHTWYFAMGRLALRRYQKKIRNESSRTQGHGC